MCKLIKRVVCFLVTALIVFFAVALWSGGEKFRWFGEKTGGAIKGMSEKLGEKADEIKQEKDKTVERIRKLAGRGEPPVDYEQYMRPDKKREGVSPDSSKGGIKEPVTRRGKEDGNKTARNSRHTLWDSILEKIRALIKG